MLKFKPKFTGFLLQSERRMLSSKLESATAGPGGSNRNSCTVDTMEIETFTRKAHVWWDLDGPIRGLHTFNRIRVPFILGDEVNSDKITHDNLKILDVGCGGGILTEYLAKCGNIVTGIDIPQEIIAIAKQHCKTNQDLKIKPTYYCTSIEDHAKLYKNHYDRVVASEVIEHVTNKELFVKSCLETLKPGGRIIFTCPTRSWLSHLITIVFCENVINCPPKGTHDYEKFITPRDLQLLLESNGCKVEDVRGFVYNMFTNVWTWSRTKKLFFATRAIKVE